MLADPWLWQIDLFLLELRLRAGLPKPLYELLACFITIEDLAALGTSSDGQQDALIGYLLMLLLVARALRLD